MVPVLLALSVKSNTRKFSLQTFTFGSSWLATVTLVSTSAGLSEVLPNLQAW